MRLHQMLAHYFRFIPAVFGCFVQPPKHHHHHHSITFMTSSPTAVAAPLFITVGPPCAGKTTWIRQMQYQQQQQKHQQHPLDTNKERNKTVLIHDVSIDDQEGVYVPVPTSWFLGQTDATATGTEGPENLMLHGQSALNRIQNGQAELVTILSRLANQISRETCESKLGNHTEASRGILAAVEEYIQQASSPSSNDSTTSSTGDSKNSGGSNRSNSATIQLPETIDLFVVEALFRADNSSPSAIVRAGQELRQHTISDAIVWGNTNCRTTDYQDALQLASQQGRPVYFVVYSETTDTATPAKTTKRDDGPLLLHARNLQELFQRSIARLVKTGRYVPSHVIVDMRRRCLEMTTTTNLPPGGDVSLECHLARLAEYELDPATRLVKALAPKRRRSNDQQQQQQQHHYSPLSQRGRGHSLAAGRFQPPWRGGGMMSGMNYSQYGNYHTTASTNASSSSITPRGGRWGGRPREHGRRYNGTGRQHDRGTNNAWR
jgi:hypothetical protein